MKKIQSIQKEYIQIPGSTGVKEVEYAYIFDDQTLEVTKVKVTDKDVGKEDEL